jgi:hypothetical protein
MLSTELVYLCTGWKCFLLCWNDFDRVGMLSPVSEYLCTGLIRVIEDWNAF